jgi:hypothetical protein
MRPLIKSASRDRLSERQPSTLSSNSKVNVVRDDLLQRRTEKKRESLRHLRTSQSWVLKPKKSVGLTKAKRTERSSFVIKLLVVSMSATFQGHAIGAKNTANTVRIVAEQPNKFGFRRSQTVDATLLRMASLDQHRNGVPGDLPVLDDHG